MTSKGKKDAFLREDKIRAYFKCSKFHSFGGTIEEEFGLKVVRDAIEILTISALKQTVQDPLMEMQGALIKALSLHAQKSDLMEPQIERYLSSCMLWLKDFFDLFSFSTYVPIFGPIEPVIKVNDTAIKLHFSGLYRTPKNGTIHALAFSPYKTEHSISNDPVSLLMIRLLQPFVKKHFPTNRPQVKLHTFYYGKNHNLGYVSLDSNSIQEETFLNVENILQNLEREISYPIIPCLYSCKYKKICLPGGKHE